MTIYRLTNEQIEGLKRFINKAKHKATYSNSKFSQDYEVVSVWVLLEELKRLGKLNKEEKQQ